MDLIEEWRKMANINLSEDERAIAMYTIIYIIEENGQKSFTYWQKLLRDFKSKDALIECIKLCFEEKFLEHIYNPYKRGTLESKKPIPTFDKYPDNIVFKTINSYLYLTISRFKKSNKAYNSNGSRILKKFIEEEKINLLYQNILELENYDEINKKHNEIQRLKKLIIDGVHIPNFQDDNGVEFNQITTDNSEATQFIKTINNHLGWDKGKKAKEFLIKNDFCFFLILRFGNYSQGGNIIELLKEDYPDDYEVKSNLSQDISRCRKKFHDHLFNSKKSKL